MISSEINEAEARGLAERWAKNVAHDGGVVDGLNGHERAALLGWVRREMEMEVERRRADYIVGTPPTPEEIGRRRDYSHDREALADHVGSLLGGSFAKGDGSKGTSLAWTLCELATVGRWV